MNLGSMFGTGEPDPDDEVAVLKAKLREAEATIERLRDALGPNHPLGPPPNCGGLFW